MRKSWPASIMLENQNLSFPVFTDLNKCQTEIDAIIDFFAFFSFFRPSSALPRKEKIPIVVATTGLSEDDQKKLTEVLQASSPVFNNRQYVLRASIFWLRHFGKWQPPWKPATILKLSKNITTKRPMPPAAPPLLLADAVNAGLNDKKTYTYGRFGREAKRTPKRIGYPTPFARGTIPGEHSVIFAGNDEIIEIKTYRHE